MSNSSDYTITSLSSSIRSPQRTFSIDCDKTNVAPFSAGSSGLMGSHLFSRRPYQNYFTSPDAPFPQNVPPVTGGVTQYCYLRNWWKLNQGVSSLDSGSDSAKRRYGANPAGLNFGSSVSGTLTNGGPDALGNPDTPLFPGPYPVVACDLGCTVAWLANPRTSYYHPLSAPQTTISQSFCFWVKVLEVPPYDNSQLWSMMGNGSKRDGYSFGFDVTTSSYSLRFGANAPNYYYVQTTWSVGGYNNKWVHVAGTFGWFDGTVDTWRLYLNGKLLGKADGYAVQNPYGNYPDTGYMALGGNIPGLGSLSALRTYYNISCSLCDVRVYETILSQDDITAIYHGDW